MGKQNKENKSRLANKDMQEENILSNSSIHTTAEPDSKKVMNGVTYRKLKPEVKQTLEKVVY